jgi:4'-phosphopantetheinyl transferase
MPSAHDLAAGAVHLWRIPVGAPDPAGLDAMARLLSPEERERAARFRFDEDRALFAASHAGLRRVLADCLGREPCELRFREGPHGKPELEGESVGLRFNLSHSGGLAVVAVARGIEVGVDVERILPKPDLESVARHFFSPREVDGLEALEAGTRRLRGFYACWTRKEALLKARGVGLSLPLDAFSVDPDPDLEQPGVVFDGNGTGGWRLRNLALGEEYAGAVAAPAAEWAGQIILNNI